jgi:Cu/Ag efflux protein CusF
MRRLSSRLFLTSALSLVVLSTMSLPRVGSAQSLTEVAAVGPNSAGAAALIRTNAKVIGIDAASRTATLRGVGGRTFEVTVSPEVGDINKLKIGDSVEIAYQESLLIHADKTKSDGIRERIDTTEVIPASGGIAASGHMVQVLGTIEKVDAKTRMITLRGPLRTVAVKAGPDISLADLKVGDSVRAEFVTATAVKVTRGKEPLN